MRKLDPIWRLTPTLAVLLTAFGFRHQSEAVVLTSFDESGGAGNPRGLYRVDPSMAELTRVGTGIAPVINVLNAIAFPEGFILGLDHDEGFYEPDASTGVGTVIGVTGVAGGGGGIFLLPLQRLNVYVDIRPWSDTNPIHPFSRGVFPVAIVGSDAFDLMEVDVTTSTFGPNGAALPHKKGGHLEDANDDGFMHLRLHYRTQEMGIAMGDTEACVKGEILDGTPRRAATTSAL